MKTKYKFLFLFLFLGGNAVLLKVNPSRANTKVERAQAAAKTRFMQILSMPEFSPLDRLNPKNRELSSFNTKNKFPLSQLRGVSQFEEMRKITSMFKEEARKDTDTSTLLKKINEGIDRIQPHLKPFRGCRFQFFEDKAKKNLCSVMRHAYVVPVKGSKADREALVTEQDLISKVPLDNSSFMSQKFYYLDSQKKIKLYKPDQSYDSERGSNDSDNDLNITYKDARREFIHAISSKQKTNPFSSNMISRCLDINLYSENFCNHMKRYPLEGFQENCTLVLDVKPRKKPQLDPDNVYPENYNHALNLICYEGNHALIYMMDSGCNTRVNAEDISDAKEDNEDYYPEGYACFKYSDSLYLENYRVFLEPRMSERRKQKALVREVREYGKRGGSSGSKSGSGSSSKRKRKKRKTKADSSYSVKRFNRSIGSGS